jgi:hypothetical protein
MKTKLALTLAGMLAFAGAAQAVTYGFEDIEVGGTPGSILEHITVEVTNAGGGSVLFTFKNAAGSHEGRIDGVSIQDLNGLLGAPVSILDSPNDVDFGTGGGAHIPPHLLSETWAFGRTGGGAARGVDPGESVGFQFAGDFDQVIADIESGDILLGIHVISLLNGASQKGLNTVPPPQVPDNGMALMLLGLGVSGVAVARRFKA